MLDIKTAVFNVLQTLRPSLSVTQKIKEYQTTDLALENIEKMVFRDSGIAVGSLDKTSEIYSHQDDKNTYELDIIYFYKTTFGAANLDNNITAVKNALRLSDLGFGSRVRSLPLDEVGEIESLTDKIKYRMLTLQVIAWESKDAGPIIIPPVTGSDIFIFNGNTKFGSECSHIHSFTGSLNVQCGDVVATGTGSFGYINAVSMSVHSAVSASHAETASYFDGSVESASHAVTADTAITASHAMTASYAVTSSYAMTASYAENAGSSESLWTGSETHISRESDVQITGSLYINSDLIVEGTMSYSASSAIITGDLEVTGTGSFGYVEIDTVESASHAINADTAISASHAENVVDDLWTELSGGDLLEYNGFETSSGWIGIGASSVSRTTEDAYSGSYSMKSVYSGNGGSIKASIRGTSGIAYKQSFWFKSDLTGSYTSYLWGDTKNFTVNQPNVWEFKEIIHQGNYGSSTSGFASNANFTCFLDEYKVETLGAISRESDVQITGSLSISTDLSVEGSVNVVDSGSFNYLEIEDNLRVDGKRVIASNITEINMSDGGTPQQTPHAVIIGGNGIIAGNSNHASIFSSKDSIIAGKYSGIYSGELNTIVNSDYSVILGGFKNYINYNVTGLTPSYSAAICGFENTVLSDYSVILGGQNLISSGSNQVVLGKYNLQGNDQDYFIIGNGVDDANRKDIFTVDPTGIVSASSYLGDGSSLTNVSAESASYAVTASHAATSSYAMTASYAENAGGSEGLWTGSASFISRQSDVQITGSLFVTEDLFVTGTLTYTASDVNVEGDITCTGNFIYTASDATIQNNLTVYETGSFGYLTSDNGITATVSATSSFIVSGGLIVGIV